MSSQHGSTDRAQGHVGGPADPASPSEDENWARLSAVSGSPLLDPRGVRLGRVKDLIVRLSSEGESAPVTGLRAWIGGRDAFVPCCLVDSLTASGTRISSRSRRSRRSGANRANCCCVPICSDAS